MRVQSSSSSRERNVHPDYRPDIDGLRAIAILSVIAFHAFPSVVRGGFIGVDIFFVISGFLISSIIFRSHAAGGFRFGEFYAHRIKRIFPALVVVLVASYLAGWFALLPDEYRQLGRHIAAAAAFVQNFVLWQEAGYFDTASELKPLMHLWSLAVEEQFYLLYPVLIWGAWKIGLNVLAALAALGLLSFGLNVHDVNADAAAAFFLPQTRIWELLAGAVLAHLQTSKTTLPVVPVIPARIRAAIEPMIRRTRLHESRLNDGLSVAGTLLILAAAFAIHKGRAFPGWWALLPIVGACLLIVAGPAAWANRVILSSRALVFVGLISYPLYLWHWPVLTFLRIVESGVPSPEFRIAGVALSVLLAWATYRWLETPIRFGRKTWLKTALPAALLAFVGGVGYHLVANHGLPSRSLPQSKLPIILELQGSPWEQPACAAKYRVRPCLESGDRPDVIVIGDSHGNHLFPGLAGLARHSILHTGTCPPLEGVFVHVLKNKAKHPCATVDFLAKNFQIVDESPNLRVAVLSSFWRLLLDGSIPTERERDAWGGLTLLSRYPQERDLTRPELVFNGLTRTVERLKQAGLKVVLVRDTPDIALELAEYCKINSPLMARDCTIPRVGYLRQRAPEDRLLRKLSDRFPDLVIVDPVDALCDQENCFLMRDGVLLFRDSHHLSASGSARVAGLLEDHLRAARP